MTEDSEPSLPPTHTGHRHAAPAAAAVYRAVGVVCTAGVVLAAQTALPALAEGLQLQLSKHLGLKGAPAASSASSAEDVLGEAAPAALHLSSGIAAPGKNRPIYVDADRMAGKPGVNTEAVGNVRLRQAGLLLRADRMSYTNADDTVTAIGAVSITRNGDHYAGPEAQLRLDTYHGYFLRPQYHFARTDAGGHADRIDFVDESHVSAFNATYTSCLAPEGSTLPWQLSTSRVDLDFDKSVGEAKNAVIRFYGVPILGAPSLTFPLTDARKSGWLPPSFDINNTSGFELSAPYYWNIAPNRDATLTPTLSTRRGPGLDTEFRYLEPHYSGVAAVDLLPNDQVAGRNRWLVNLKHQGVFDRTDHVDVQLLRVSDDDYWKDFSRNIDSVTPRLLNSTAAWQHPIAHAGVLDTWLGATQTYSYFRVESWQTLRDLDATDPSATIVPPYSREPQIGLSSEGARGNWQWNLDTEFNRFVQNNLLAGSTAANGDRAHLVASTWRAFHPVPGVIGWTVTPKVSLNAASYYMDQVMSDGQRSASRVIPTVSLDSNWVLQKDSSWLGQAYTQTLEPRLYYVKTPYHNQLDLPNFDSAALDFNDSSIFSDNAFSGVDRVADLDELTAGVTTRLIDARTGAEAMRLGVAQRTLFRDQRITESGAPLTQHLSDILLLGSASILPRWSVDGTLQYSPQIHQTVRTVTNLRYSPTAWRTFSVSYRYTQGLLRQVDLGWQWPIAGPAAHERDIDAARRQHHGDPTCSGSWYAVGHTSYSLRDRRLVNSIAGFEYDAGCWIGRVVAERVSTGAQQSNMRLMFQLELVGLSRLGSSPLKVLRDNIPGYRLLRDENQDALNRSSSSTLYPFDDE